MGRHLADHETPKLSDGLSRFLRVAKADHGAFWRVLWKRAAVVPKDRRVVEYIRIDRGRRG
jgi:hypothetical protein